MTETNLAVFVSGGPGPGINACISSIVKNASLKGWRVFGFKRSFKSFKEDWRTDIFELKWDQVSLITRQGGSFIPCVRFNPLSDSSSKKKFEEFLEEFRISKLAIIGGDGSSNLAVGVSKNYPEVCVVVCPKTIDNDLPLSSNTPSLGFSTARNVGAQLVITMGDDARSSERWFVVTCMGRNAGFLALGVALAAEAHAVIIPEEVPSGTSLSDLVDIVKKVILARKKAGKMYGIAVIAEGVLAKTDISFLSNPPRDDLGRLVYRDLQIGKLIAEELKKDLCDMIILHKDLGFELRAAAPLAYDLEYGITLGFGAVEFLAQNRIAGVVLRDDLRLKLLSFSEILDSEGKVKTRQVDLESDAFIVAKRRMNQWVC